MPESASTPVPATCSGPAGHRHRVLAGGGAGSVLPSYIPGSLFALQAASRITQCPPPPPDPTEPSADHLVYGLTLPSAVGTPVVAQEAAEVVLDVHGVEDELVESMIALVHELTLHACRFTGAGEMIYLVLRRTGDIFQAVVHDTHAPHTHLRLADQCVERRKVSLAVVRELSERHQGEWGFAAAQPPAAGVCTWATLVHVPRIPLAPDAAPERAT